MPDKIILQSVKTILSANRNRQCMAHLVRATVFITCVAGNSGVAQTPAPASKNFQPQFSLVIALEQSTIKAGSGVRVEAVTTNISHRDIVISREALVVGSGEQGGDSAMKILVFDSAGHLVPIQPPDQSACLGRPDCVVRRSMGGSSVPRDVRLARRKSVHDRLEISPDFYDLSPGTYAVQAETTVHVVSGNMMSYESVKSNVVMLTVTP